MAPPLPWGVPRLVEWSEGPCSRPFQVVRISQDPGPFPSRAMRVSSHCGAGTLWREAGPAWAAATGLHYSRELPPEWQAFTWDTLSLSMPAAGSSWPQKLLENEGAGGLGVGKKTTNCPMVSPLPRQRRPQAVRAET